MVDFMLAKNKVYKGDCLSIMKGLPDKYFDLIITDPPYGINICSNGKIGGDKPFGNNKATVDGDNLAKAKDYGVQEWDKNIPSKEVFDEMIRVSKNQIIFGGNYMTDNLTPSSCWIVWDKDNSGNFADCELAWTSFQRATKLFKHRWNGMLQEDMGWKEKRFHPTQKPVPLGRWIIENFAEKGQTIFDPFCGSGSFLVACKNLGYDYVGVDISKKYCEVAQERLNQTQLKEWGDI